MATSHQWEDIKEDFKCPICLELLSEPKLLACLHRYCRDCLDNVIKNSHAVFKCPMCMEDTDIPVNGVDDFKTDFAWKQLVERLQKPKLPTEPNLTREGPKCDIHSAKVCEFVCLTCSNSLVNSLICNRCVSDTHKKHDFVDLTTLSEIKDRKLTEALNISQKLKDIKQKLFENSKIEIQKLVEICDIDVKEITLDMEKIREQIQKVELEGHKTKKDEVCALKQTGEDKILNIKEEYEIIIENKVNQIDEQTKALNKPHRIKLAKLYEKLKELKDIQKLLEQSMKAKLEGKVTIIDKLSQQLDKATKQLHSIDTSSANILVLENDLTSLGTEDDGVITKIKAKCENLEKEKFFDIRIDYRESVFRKNRAPSITEHAEITHVKALGLQWYIDGIASNDVGQIAITGSTKDNESAIVLIDFDGMLVSEKKFSRSVLHPGKRRFCDFLTRSKIASVYQHDEIGVYDVSNDSSYKSISSGFNVTCMAIDTFNDLILVGSDKAEVHIFDFQLVRQSKLTLPQIIEGPRDISVHKKDRLLVCDYDGRRIYETTLQGSVSKAEYEFSRPDLDGEDWKPFTLCTDRYRCIFALWMTGRKFSSGRRILVQYGDYGRKLLLTKEVDRDSRCVTVVDQEDGGKLLIATWITGNLYSYNLKYEDAGLKEM